MANYVVSDTSLGSVADAIRTKGGTSAPLTYPRGFIDAIDAIQTGGGSAVIQALSVTQNGTYTAPSGVDGYSPVTVSVSGGDTPIPADGKTRIFIHIADETPDNRLTFYLRFKSSAANNTTVDWGDGTVETLGDTSATKYEHKYTKSGDYIIVITVNSGTISFNGTYGSSGDNIFGNKGASNRYNTTRVKRIIFSANIKEIGDYACESCMGLESVTILSNITSIGKNAFNNCYALKNINIPNGITNISDESLSNCYVITSITLPDSLINIGSYFLASFYGITSITIPHNVSSIGNWAFSSCLGLSRIHMQSTTPPILGKTISLASDCIIYVPQGSLSAYQQATNWSVYASYMQEEPT